MIKYGNRWVNFYLIKKWLKFQFFTISEKKNSLYHFKYRQIRWCICIQQFYVRIDHWYYLLPGNISSAEEE